MNPLVVARCLALPGRLESTPLNLESGALTCLIGPNGSGKTSLLHALADIGRPAGDVRIGGIDPKTVPAGRRNALLGFLPASRDITWPLSARDVVALGGGDPDAALARLGLSAMAERRMDHMSTGERSRVLIARVLAPASSLLLLDEPTANLDPFWKLTLMDRLRALSRDRAMLIAVHDLEIARAYADRLIVMDEGRIAADGEPRRLIDGPEMAAIFGVERVKGVWRPVA